MTTTPIIKSTDEQIKVQSKFINLLNNAPMPDLDKLINMGLFVKRQDLSRVILMNELYKKIINVHGSIFEFGVRWGQNLALFSSFRGMYEPFNYTRKIVGFDTFEGFPSVSAKDRGAQIGEFAVGASYYDYLTDILDAQESESPLAHIKKYELIKGDATKTCKEYLKKNPETIIAFAFFDFDIYEPTKVCLELCKERFVKGSIIAFDELNHPHWPGETEAVQEVLGLNNIKLKRVPYCPNVSYFEVE